jgi:hypothetical protein
MIRKQAFGDALREANIQFRDRTGIMANLENKKIPVPHMPNTLRFVKDVLEAISQLEKSDSLNVSRKKILYKLDTLYPGLKRPEICSATRLFSAGAHLADPEKDVNIVQAFNRAYDLYSQDCTSKHKKPKPKPRLVVMESDFLFNGTQRWSGEQASVLVTTSLGHHLSEDALTSSFAHELNHVDRDLNHHGIIQFMVKPVHWATRNAIKRRREFAADHLSVELVGAEAALQRLEYYKKYNEELADAMRPCIEETMTYLKEKYDSKSARLLLKILESRLQDTLDAAPADSPPSFCQRVLHAPEHPTLGQRIARARQAGAESSIHSRFP